MSVGAVAAVGIVGVGRYLRLRRFATTDGLTGLPNRHAFERRARVLLRRAGAGGPAACLVLVDLDGFKAVNDSAGHAAGDSVLRAVGAYLRRSVRRDDMVARWGGDEFVVLLVGIADRDAGTRRAASLLADLGTRLDAAAVTHRAPVLGLTASFGVAAAPADGRTVADLLAVADAAMYAAKRANTPASGLTRRRDLRVAR